MKNKINFLFLSGITSAFAFSEGDGASTVNFEIPGLSVAAYNDAGKSTGSTLFYFPQGATANVDVRGGGVAATEISLLDEGSYSNYIDAIVLNGGSCMGLAAVDGVKEYIFNRRIGNKPTYDTIPVVLGAVVYDYGGRVLPEQNVKIYPDKSFGSNLMKNLSTSAFPVGRVGAGSATTVNKIDKKRWGGQGASFLQLKYAKVLAAVVLNPMGDIIKEEKSYSSKYPPLPTPTSKNPPVKGNTTLSVIITDAKLDRNQLKRLAIAVHTSMANRIRPFHTYGDGDILFAVSTNATAINGDQEFELTMKASEQMALAIEKSVDAANQ